MPSYTNLDCILDQVDVVNPCTADQSAVIYFLDDLGISLATTAKAADERYRTGQALVDAKKRIALDEVYHHLTRNVTRDCDLDEADGILCDEKVRVGRVIWYKTAALIFKEISIDSMRYNDLIHYSGAETLGQMIYYDSSFISFTNLENVPPGLYQKELERLESLRNYIETTCCADCSGTRWSLTLP